MNFGEWVGIAMAIGIPATSGLIWAIRLEGRLNTHEAVCAQRYMNLTERHAETTDKLDKMDAKLDRLVEFRP